MSGRPGSSVEPREGRGVTGSQIARLSPLAFLALEIVESVLAEPQTPQAMTEVLAKRVELPIDGK